MKETRTVCLSVSASSDEAFGGEIRIEPIRSLRVFRGRREVWLAKITGRQGRIVAKKFLPGNRQTKESRREIRGLRKLSERQIRGPQWMFTAKDRENNVWVVADYIENSNELLELIVDPPDSALRQRLIHDFLLTLFRHWKRGVYQTDSHLKNFLWDGRFIYTIDVGLIRFRRRAFSARRQAVILSKILGCYTVEIRKQFLDAIPQICDEMDERDLPRHIQSRSFERRVKREEKKALNRIRRKSRRECSQFLAISHGQRKLICQRSLDSRLIERLKNAPEELMQSGTRLKSGNTCTVQQIDWMGRPMVLKRYNRKPFFYRLRHAFCLGRAMRSWVNAIVMDQFKIPTAAPLAVVEQRKWGLLDRAYFLAEHFDGESLRDYFERVPVRGSEAECTLARLSVLFGRLRDLRVVHGDFKASNLLVNDLEIALIDTDGLRFLVPPRRFSKRFQADFRRLLANWAKDDTVRSVLEDRFSLLFDR